MTEGDSVADPNEPGGCLELSDDPPPEPAVRPRSEDQSSHDDGRQFSRRGFLGKSAKKLAYVAPLTLLFRPSQVLAGSGGSLITAGP